MSGQATPFIGSDAEAVKVRAEAFDDLRDIFNQHDVSDPASWTALVTHRGAYMLADIQQMPNVVYGLSHLLVTCIDQADKSGNPMLAMATRAAMMQVLNETTSSSKETDNEDDQPRTAS